MSQITTVYTALVAKMVATYPQHLRLTDADDLENNDQARLRKGWGLRLAQGRNTRRVICPEYHLERQAIVSLTREGPALNSDNATREAAKLALLEDLHLLIAQSVTDLTLDGAVINFQFREDTGPEELLKDGRWYVAIEATFGVEYSQQV